MTPVRILAPSALCRSREGCSSAGGVHVVGRDGGGMELEDPWGPFQAKGSSTIFQGCYIPTESASSLPCHTAEERNPGKPEVIFITHKGCSDPAGKAQSGFLISPTMQEASRAWVMHWRECGCNCRDEWIKTKFVSIVHFVSPSEDKYSNWIKLKELKNLHSVHLCPLPHSHTFQKWAPFFWKSKTKVVKDPNELVCKHPILAE